MPTCERPHPVRPAAPAACLASEETQRVFHRIRNRLERSLGGRASGRFDTVVLYVDFDAEGRPAKGCIFEASRPLIRRKAEKGFASLVRERDGPAAACLAGSEQKFFLHTVNVRSNQH